MNYDDLWDSVLRDNLRYEREYFVPPRPKTEPRPDHTQLPVRSADAQGVYVITEMAA